jgi:feruloyl esterase
MGGAAVDSFARLFVLPQTDHVLNGRSYGVDGDGQEAAVQPIPNTYDRVGLMTAWVEKDIAPGRALTATAGARSLPMCSYPEYPRYVGGPAGEARSYTCASR